MLHRYEVGKLYEPPITRFPETPSLVLGGPGGTELVLFYGSPRPMERKVFHEGRCRFGWDETAHHGILTYKIGGMPWSDLAYNPHLYEDPQIDAMRPEQHLAVAIIMVDAHTGLITNMRACTWPANFGNAVRRTVLRLKAQPPISHADARAEMMAVYDQYTPPQLVARAKVTCIGGMPDPAVN